MIDISSDYHDISCNYTNTKIFLTQMINLNHRVFTLRLQDIYCEKIVIGDLVKVCRDEDVPCDIVILYSETPKCCYVTTSNLDGETNLKVKMRSLASA